MELRGDTNAAVVRVLPVELIAELPSPDSVDTPDYSIIRRNAGGYTERSIFCLAFQVGSRVEHHLFHRCDRFLQMDVRGRAITRAIGKDGITEFTIMFLLVGTIESATPSSRFRFKH